ncbi:hypothetical protein JTB14_010982 [Gonioctena quinquepunctata]|nr:hypothetical protein JTB14_010982 [Gonioctena quinquepunctata]
MRIFGLIISQQSNVKNVQKIGKNINDLLETAIILRIEVNKMMLFRWKNVHILMFREFPNGREGFRVRSILRIHDDSAMLVESVESSTIKKALESDKSNRWRAAMDGEMQSLKENVT